MKSFLSRILIFLLPIGLTFLMLLASYIIFDPFKVLKTYSDYSNTGVVTNRDFVSTEVYLRNERSEGYNSFIFGNSRTVAFQPDTWKKYLKEEDRPFMFDASLESIYGIWKKLRFLDERKVIIKNAILLLDHDITFARDKNHTGHLFMKHPQVAGKSWLAFHSEFFGAYCDINFLSAYLEYQRTGTYSGKMKKYFLTKKISYHPVTNGVKMEDLDRELAAGEDRYYEARKAVFYKRNGQKIKPKAVIRPSQVTMMKEIISIFEKQGTDYRIVIPPTYDQVKFSLTDQSLLRELFGHRLYDFSGENALTSNRKNYYETAHFRPHVGDSIMKFMYRH